MKILDFTEAIDPVPYHEILNPKLWQEHTIIPEVRYSLLRIAHHFAEFLQVPKLHLRDITISGSNAAYGYSEHSDLDLHLVVDIPKDKVELVQLYDAKKNQYNTNYDIQVKGIDVELYVQDSKQEHYSAGIFSLLKNKWLIEPKNEEIRVTPKEIKNKARNYAGKINLALRSKDLNTARETMDSLRRLRRAGLERNGEFSVENLAFKLLRARGQIDKLRKLITKLESAKLSLKEMS
jgi:hypothetical protein